MTFTVAAFVTRLPTISPEDFAKAYDAHIPQLASIVGEAGKPDSVTRYYVRRSKADASKPLVYFGDDSFSYDLVALLNFKDEEAAKVFKEKYAENKEKIGGKLAEFADVNKFKVVALEQAA